MARSSPGGKDCISALALIYRRWVSARRPVCYRYVSTGTHLRPFGSLQPINRAEAVPPDSSMQLTTKSTEATDQRSDGHIGNAGENVGKPGLGFDPVHNWRSS